MKLVILLSLLPMIGFGSFKNQKHSQEYVWDFSVSGGTSNTSIELSAISGKSDLPVGAVVEKVSYKVLTDLVSSGSASVTVGNGDDDDGYIDDVLSTGLDANGVSNSYEKAGALLWDNSNDAPKNLYIDDATTGAFNIKFNANVTAGKILFWVDYYVPSL